MSGTILPEGFAALEPFANAWAVEGSACRDACRSSSSEEERQAFYDAAKDLLAPALAYLDTRPLGAFEACEQRLMDMMLSLAHVSLAVELQGDDEPRHATYRRHMRLTRTPADMAA